jgi:predicted lipoprotein with Yx(FWY)xxD motif
MDEKINSNESEEIQAEVTVKTNHLNLIFAVVIVAIMGTVFVFLAFFSNSSPTETIEKKQVQTDVDVTQEITPSPSIVSNSVPNITSSDSFGFYFHDPKTKLALYTNTDNLCEGECLNSWSPFIAYPNEIPETDGVFADGIFSVVPVEGTEDYQHAWNGSGLYTYVEDKKAGDMFGLGIDSWEVAHPFNE